MGNVNEEDRTSIVFLEREREKRALVALSTPSLREKYEAHTVRKYKVELLSYKDFLFICVFGDFHWVLFFFFFKGFFLVFSVIKVSKVNIVKVVDVFCVVY